MIKKLKGKKLRNEQSANLLTNRLRDDANAPSSI